MNRKLIPAITKAIFNAIRWRSISNATWVFDYEMAKTTGEKQ